MKTVFTLFTSCILAVSAKAASLIVNWSMTPSDGRELTNRTGIPLSAGTPAAGDGTLLELGYYSMATASNPFAGSWTVLSSSTMGDNGIEVAGRFSTSSILGDAVLPGLTTSTPLSIRYYDSASFATSTYFNAVSNTSGAWNYVIPIDPSLTINLAIDKNVSIVFQGGVEGAFRTVVPIPEPSHMILVLVGGFIALSRRRRE
jgi:hypothetical protein